MPSAHRGTHRATAGRDRLDTRLVEINRSLERHHATVTPGFSPRFFFHPLSLFRDLRPLPRFLGLNAPRTIKGGLQDEVTILYTM